VCYVYQNRYITPLELDGQNVIRLYDFDPLRVRQERLSRIHLAGEPSSSPPAKRISLLRRRSASNPLDGERGGIHLVTAETVLRADDPLMEESRTGRDLPYTYVDLESEASVTLIDGERVVTVEVSGLLF
jgi:hypothetical protein